MLKVENLYSGYRSDILKDINFEIEKNSITCILGANGCGKTTLLKNILCLLKPSRGMITLDGQDVYKMKDTERAKKIAYIPQAHVPPFPFRVRDVVLMGRYSYLSKLSRISEHDWIKAENAMKMLGIMDLAEKSYTELSGGQRQMVLIARALAQEPDLLIMDEPANNLDFGNQYILLEQMCSLAGKNGMSIIMVTHSPDHALYCANHVIAIKDGRIVADGKPSEVINEGNMKDIYQTDVRIGEISFGEAEKTIVCVAVPEKRRGIK